MPQFHSLPNIKKKKSLVRSRHPYSGAQSECFVVLACKHDIHHTAKLIILLSCYCPSSRSLFTSCTIVSLSPPPSACAMSHRGLAQTSCTHQPSSVRMLRPLDQSQQLGNCRVAFYSSSMCFSCSKWSDGIILQNIIIPPRRVVTPRCVGGGRVKQLVLSVCPSIRPSVRCLSAQKSGHLAIYRVKQLLNMTVTLKSKKNVRVCT